MEGEATVSLLPRGEEYVMTLPYAHCKGILMGMCICTLFVYYFFFFVHIFISNLFITYYFHNITGTMTMELGGKVSIVCSKTGYSCELEFKLRVSCIFREKIWEGVREVAMVTSILLILFIRIVFKWSVCPKAKCLSSQVLKFPSTQSPMYPS